MVWVPLSRLRRLAFPVQYPVNSFLESAHSDAVGDDRPRASRAFGIHLTKARCSLGRNEVWIAEPEVDETLLAGFAFLHPDDSVTNGIDDECFSSGEWLEEEKKLTTDWRKLWIAKIIRRLDPWPFHSQPLRR